MVESSFGLGPSTGCGSDYSIVVSIDSTAVLCSMVGRLSGLSLHSWTQSLVACPEFGKLPLDSPCSPGISTFGTVDGNCRPAVYCMMSTSPLKMVSDMIGLVGVAAVPG